METVVCLAFLNAKGGSESAQAPLFRTTPKISRSRHSVALLPVVLHLQPGQSDTLSNSRGLVHKVYLRGRRADGTPSLSLRHRQYLCLAQVPQAWSEPVCLVPLDAGPWFCSHRR